MIENRNGAVGPRSGRPRLCFAIITYLTLALPYFVILTAAVAALPSPYSRLGNYVHVL